MTGPPLPVLTSNYNFRLKFKTPVFDLTLKRQLEWMRLRKVFTEWVAEESKAHHLQERLSRYSAKRRDPARFFLSRGAQQITQDRHEQLPF